MNLLLDLKHMLAYLGGVMDNMITESLRKLQKGLLSSPFR